MLWIAKLRRGAKGVNKTVRFATKRVDFFFFVWFIVRLDGVLPYPPGIIFRSDELSEARS